MFRRQVSALSLVAFLAFVTPAAAAEITFESDVWDLGGTFDLSILVSDAPDLFTYGVDLLFDATVLSFVGASNGTLLPADNFGSVNFDNFVGVFNNLRLPSRCHGGWCPCRADVSGYRCWSRQYRVFDVDASS